MSATERIKELIERETQAWNESDVDLLLSLFHPDLIWIWPASGYAGDLLASQLQVSRFDPDRWRAGWSGILANELLANDRQILSITESPEGDSAVAVVNVETRWRTPKGQAGWTGQATKCFVRTGDDWKMIAHIGL